MLDVQKAQQTDRQTLAQTHVQPAKSPQARSAQFGLVDQDGDGYVEAIVVRTTLDQMEAVTESLEAEEVSDIVFLGSPAPIAPEAGCRQTSEAIGDCVEDEVDLVYRFLRPVLPHDRRLYLLRIAVEQALPLNPALWVPDLQLSPDSMTSFIDLDDAARCRYFERLERVAKRKETAATQGNREASIGGFTAVHNDIMLDGSYSGNARLLYFAIVAHCMGRSYCTPGDKVLTQELGIGERELRRCKAELQAEPNPLLRVVPRYKNGKRITDKLYPMRMVPRKAIFKQAKAALH